MGRADKVYRALCDLGFAPSLIDLRFCKPLPKELESTLRTHKIAFVFSDSYRDGGVGSAILEQASAWEMLLPLYSLELESTFVPHGDTKSVEHSVGLSEQALLERVLSKLRSHNITP